jgi:hypothetical protein
VPRAAARKRKESVHHTVSLPLDSSLDTDGATSLSTLLCSPMARPAPMWSTRGSFACVFVSLSLCMCDSVCLWNHGLVNLALVSSTAPLRHAALHV